LENKITKLIVKMHENIDHLLKEKKIIPSENEMFKHKMEILIKEVLHL
jgi:hypothetical protein